jgi:hypothetical protein
MSGDGPRGGFECFLDDMRDRPSKKHSLDRIDCNGNYEPGNCRWATMNEQQRNKTNNRVVVFRDVQMIMQDAVKQSGIPEWTVYERLSRGWSEQRALTQPVRVRRSSRSEELTAGER